MNQFDVCRVRSTGTFKLALVLQHDWLADLDTVVVAPILLASAGQPITRINPSIMLDGQKYLVALDLITSIPRASLGPRKGAQTELRNAIKRGLDTLFDGF